ncbi:hypothetical protein BURMUCF2_0590 [Burkholderia multivorans CF2]|nr:hypothetical protein BURMUCF2_0590 [Burkholderia multivorans CF2]
MQEPNMTISSGASVRTIVAALSSEQERTVHMPDNSRNPFAT